MQERELRQTLQGRVEELESSCRTLTQELSKVLDHADTKIARRTRELELEVCVCLSVFFAENGTSRWRVVCKPSAPNECAACVANTHATR
jgi:hypothetical protein